MAFSSPLRYPGGKGKLTNFIKLIFDVNGLQGGQYLEPYAGGAAVALNLLFDKYVTKIHLNDLNPAIFSFWNSIIYTPEELCKKIFDTNITMEEWIKQKEILSNPSQHNMTDVGFSAFFLNRTNRSGILSAGVIGGKAQLGTWKLDARFNKDTLIKRIEKIAFHKDKISIYNLDTKELILKLVPKLPKNLLIYFDPPYYVKGKELYQNHYTHDDHLKIAQLIQNIKHPWIVSYDAVDEIFDMYAERAKLTYGLSYSAQLRYKGGEVMFFSDNLKVPCVDSPLKLDI